MRVVGVNRTRHRGIGRRYGSGGGRVTGGGGRRRWRHVGGARGSDEEEAGDRHGGSWYRGWRWRWQSQCPSARTGSRRVAVNDLRQLLFTLHRASRRAKRATAGGGGKGAREGRGRKGRRGPGGRPTREEETRGGAEEEEEDSRWKANGQTGHRKGGNEMRRVCSPVPRRAFALARSLASAPGTLLDARPLARFASSREEARGSSSLLSPLRGFPIFRVYLC